ncbi:hypothetical protein RclHR1_00020040 [Rhizophagus clarus]|uniref:Kinase-like domain-containing protein n=1 Tax=Rhizophagus clarus TaxID=94130 RepID=A0A2Z6QQH6_9GLOM|nr:hypothetical protein RclHR1_00020040 [Rhizophagus clarus]GES80171.1 kinase-like domain-containing protein [Rhizophagus clarus]
MTTVKKTDEPNNCINWVENAFIENYIKYYDYSNFTNIEEIDNNSIGKILRANWKGTDTLLIVKSSNKLTIKEIINEIKIQREVDFHPNILRFYGISKSVNQMDKYSLVLEYADGGSMSSYLKKNFDKLEWDDKYRFALQLANAVECIHNEEIIHCGLNAHNIFIHNNNIKLANFHLSKKVSEASEHIITGLLPYMDPKYLYNKFNDKDGSHPYEINTKLDIYSIGVLFWQLSSGRDPFDDENTKNDSSLAMEIINGKRENIIIDTPFEYSDLYTACWSYDPNIRPTIQQVILTLKSIIFQGYDNNKEIIYEENDNAFDNLVLSDFIIGPELENEFVPYIIKQAEIEMFDLIDNFKLINSIKIVIDRLIMLLIKMHDKNEYTIAETAKFISRCIFNSNKTSTDILSWLNENLSKPQYTLFLGFLYYNGLIVENDDNEAFRLFLRASEDHYPIAQVYLSKCYHDGKGTEIDNTFAITYLCNGIENNNACEQLDDVYENKFAQYNLGLRYKDGNGVNKDEVKAFEWLKKSAEQDYKHAQCKLGSFYEKGIGTEKNIEKAIYWYRKAAENGSKHAIYNLSLCYQYINNVEIYENKSFELFNVSIEQENMNTQFEIDNANNIETVIDRLIVLLIKMQDEKGYNFTETTQFIYQCIFLSVKTSTDIFNWLVENLTKPQYIFFLGFLYYNGIIVENNDDEAFRLFSKASEENYPIAQVYLSKCYQEGRGTAIDNTLAFTYLRNSIENNSVCGQLYLGNLYEDGTGRDVDLNKAIYWYQKAADSGNLSGLYHLGKCYQFGKGIKKDENEAFKLYNKSAEQGNMKALFSLGTCYDKGIGVDVNHAKAFDLYKIAADEGNHDLANNNLGSLYENGIGTEINLKMAFNFYKKAAKNGDNYAQYKLGKFYQFGYGVEKDEAKAFKWYEKSAEQDYSDAQNQLGILYESGISTKKDLKKAAYWYKRAASNGNEDAQHNLYNRQVFDWFEESIKNKEITYYDYKDFNDISKIGSGGFASVYITSWKNTQSKFAIKKFDKISITINEVKNEINLMKKVDFHPNIIKFCGVTKLRDELTKGINYLLVLEYADNGTLRKYLKKNFDTFNWERQLNFAKDIASAIVCLHDNGIVHRDLHSNNILVHQHTIKLADFGLSRRLQQSVCHTNKACGVIPYMDPIIFNMRETTDKQSLSYDLTKKSDIYSLGVLFWELTSGLSPFNFENRTYSDYALIKDILEGKREKPIPNTNAKFVEIYQKCWRHKPEERPSIKQVILDLNNIDSKNNTSNSELNDSEYINTENHSFERSKNTEELGEDAMESVNNNLHLANYM